MVEKIKQKKIIKKPAKKSVKKVIKKSAKKMAQKAISRVNLTGKEKLIGRITHYFSNIEVAVINLVSILKDGDMIRVVGGQETDFEQKVKSMQIDHEEVMTGKKGDSVGMKIDEKVHEGYKVYKVYNKFII